MIDNATLLSIAPPTVADGKGGRTPATPTAVEVRCYLGTPRRAQLLAKANVVADATATLYVPLTHAAGIVAGGTVRVRVDGLDAAGYRVLHRSDRVKHGGLSHAEMFLKGL